MSHTKSLYPRWILTVTALFLLAAPLAAGESRWYFNGKIGEASLNGQFSPTSAWSFDGSDETGSIEVGYDLHRYLAIQGGYHDLGTYQGVGAACPINVPCIARAPVPTAIVPVTADVAGLSLSLLPRLPIGERFSVYGKLGVMDWDTDIDSVSGNGRIERLSDRDLLAGAGVQYVFPRGIGVLVEYQRLDFDHDSTSVGASWRF